MNKRIRQKPIGYTDGVACCKDCNHTRQGGSVFMGQRLRCYRVLPSRAVGRHKTCPYSRWRKST